MRKHRDFFLKGDLYADGMFWYDLFVLIGSAAMKIKTDKKQKNIPKKNIYLLTQVLIDIAEYATPTGGDIMKRNHEALGNTLFCFYSPELLEYIRKSGKESADQNTMDFIEWTCSKVEGLVKREYDPGGNV